MNCYNQFELLKQKYSYLKTDPYYISVAKNIIEILKKNGIDNYRNQILNYLSIIENNLIPENGSENRVFLAGVYFELGENKKAKELLNLNIARKEYYSVSTDMLSLIEYSEAKDNNTLNSAILFELNNTNIDINNQNGKLEVSIHTKFSSNKFIYLIVDGKFYPNPYLSNSESDMYIFSENVEIKNKKPYEIIIGLLNKKNQLIEMTYDCNYLDNDKKIINLLDEVNFSVEDIESCLLPSLYKQLNNFSYKEKDDKE